MIKRKVDDIRSNSNIVFDDYHFPSFGKLSLTNKLYLKYRFGYYYLWSYEEWRPYDKSLYRLIVCTNIVDILLFYIFKEATWPIASDYALEHSNEYEDQRIPLFYKHIELLQSLGLKKKLIDSLNNEYQDLLKNKLHEKKDLLP